MPVLVSPVVQTLVLVRLDSVVDAMDNAVTILALVICKVDVRLRLVPVCPTTSSAAPMLTVKSRRGVVWILASVVKVPTSAQIFLLLPH